jgi:preprotein translocase subunit YajC
MHAFLNTLVLAMASPTAGTGAQGQSAGWQGMMVSLMPMVLIFVIMYFLLIRPQQKKAREHQELLNQLKAGDRVVTTGGLYGTITAVHERTFLVKVADNVVVEVSRAAVTTVLGKDAA